MAVHNLRRVAGVAAAIYVAMAGAGSMVFASARSARLADPGMRRVPVRAAAVGPLTGKVLGGFTSQGWPAVIDISRNGRRIVDARIGITMTCSLGDSFGTRDGWSRVPIARGGSVHAMTGITPVSDGTIKLVGGSDSLTGVVNRKRWTFHGVWHLQLTFEDTSTGQTDQCDSGQVAFDAIL